MKLWNYEISESIWRDLISALYIESLLINWRSNVFWFLFLLILIQDKSKSGDNFVLEFSWLLDHDWLHEVFKASVLLLLRCINLD